MITATPKQLPPALPTVEDVIEWILKRENERRKSRTAPLTKSEVLQQIAQAREAKTGRA